MARRRITSQIIDFDNVPPEALVPENEQPYEIPTHWRWVRFNLLVSEGGDSTRKLPRKSYLSLGAYPVIDQGQEFVGGYSNDETLVQDHADAVVVFGDHTRCVKFVDFPFIQGADGIKILVSSPVLDPRYLYFWLESQPVDSLGYRRHFPLLKKMAFPLPPIDEQKAIVEKLQSANQKIDDVLETLDQFLDQVPQQRAFIIQAGVSGMLTEDWRAENGQSREDWVESTLGGTFRWASGGTPARSNKAYFQGHIPWIKSGELPDGLIDGVAEYITEDAISSSSAKVFPKDSVAIAMYGATIGRTGILAFDAATNQAVAVAAKNEEVDSRLLFYFLQASREGFVSLGKGGAQPNISQTVIKSFPFEYPVGDEQGEIVAVIEAALSGIETAYKITLGVREKVQAAKRAVRNRALRGIV